MNKCGAKDFQDKRTDLLIQLLEESSKTLINEGTEIKPSSIIKKLTKIFLEREIETKYFVTEQTIRRNKKYSNVWMHFKKIQEKSSSQQKNNSLKKFDNEFQLRDYCDILQQDYIEAMDMNKWLDKQVEDLNKEIEELKKTKGTEYTVLANNDSHRYKLVTEIKELLDKGPLVITRLSNQNVVIKNTNTINEDRRIQFSEDEWKTL